MKPAAKMKHLIYDCNLEKSAKRWARKCLWKHSEWKGKDGHKLGENLFHIYYELNGKKLKMPMDELLERAMSGWWEAEYKELPYPIPEKLHEDWFDQEHKRKTPSAHLS